MEVWCRPAIPEEDGQEDEGQPGPHRLSHKGVGCIRETGQLVMFVLQAQRPECDPQNPFFFFFLNKTKQLGIALFGCDRSTGKVETGRSLGLTGEPALPAG